MRRQTDVEKLRNALSHLPTQRAKPRVLIDELEWTADKFQRVLIRAELDPRNCIARGRGGVVEYTGNEVGCVPLLYRHAFRILEGYWSRSRGYRNVKVFRTAHGGRRGAADWIHPDAVLQADPVRRTSKDAPPLLHSFEIERPGGFKIESIFQAFVQGRGADFSWVIYSESDVKTTEYLDRVHWAAGAVDVGLISYVKPGSWTTWKSVREPKKRTPTAKERVHFQHYGLGETPVL
jgi:hypothetical protein